MPDSRPPRSRNTNQRSSGSAGSRRRRTDSAPTDPDVAAKLREIESSGEPVSISEAIRPEEMKPLGEEEAKSLAAGDVVDVTELQRMSVEELAIQAANEGIADPAGLSRRDLIFQILKQRVKSCGIMQGEGTLQILPDGFGFLRSAAYHYLSCPDDIYVSPSQIRKFSLRDGSVVKGQIRPPKENERYFALLRVNSVNGRDPSESSRQKHFDDLTPLHPNSRIVMEYDPKCISTRVVDLVAPIGFGQRGLIVSPPRAGKTVLMQKMARATLGQLSGCLRDHAAD